MITFHCTVFFVAQRSIWLVEVTRCGNRTSMLDKFFSLSWNYVRSVTVQLRRASEWSETFSHFLVQIDRRRRKKWERKISMEIVFSDIRMSIHPGSSTMIDFEGEVGEWLAFFSSNLGQVIWLSCGMKQGVSIEGNSSARTLETSFPWCSLFPHPFPSSPLRCDSITKLVSSLLVSSAEF